MVIATFMVALIAVGGAGCLGGDDDNGTETITMGVSQWTCDIATAEILKLTYEQAGYEVDMESGDLGPLYQALSDSQFDIGFGWLPVTQGNYWDEYSDDIEWVGNAINEAKCGLVVPQYVYDAGVTSIYDLANHTEEFDGEIIGIEAGAGIMRNTEDNAIPDYNLTDYDLSSGSSAGAFADLQSAYDNDEWAVITGWTPHWSWARMDLAYLEDPLNAYGEEDHIANLARLGFQDDMPEAYSILERYNLPLEELHSVMLEIEENEVPEEEAAQNWVDDNQDMVDSWING
ncbi:MAG: glycine betaine ABC transporter substrate-binding protein [Methanomassiliicoccales archaeon]